MLKIENIIAEALETGPLRKQKVIISDGLKERLHSTVEGKVPDDVLGTLIDYYIANRQEDTDWVVLPVSSFDACFGTSFGRRWLRLIPETIIERSSQSFGVSRYLIRSEFLDGAEVAES